MYFKNRTEAGEKLAALLERYRYENCAVVALSDGAVLVSEPIATSLHSVLTMLLTEEVTIPGESSVFGSVNQTGKFVYNNMFSEGELENYYNEYHGYLEDQKREKFQHINRLLGGQGILEPDMLRGHVVILVADGLVTGVSLDAAAEYLKPLKLQRLIIASPVASVEAVDRMHILGDELHVLNVTDNYLDTEHYYDDNTIPSHEETIQKLSQTLQNLG